MHMAIKSRIPAPSRSTAIDPVGVLIGIPIKEFLEIFFAAAHISCALQPVLVRQGA